MGIDPLADGGGQQSLSPYHAMGCNPVTMVDPSGLRFYNAGAMPSTSTPAPYGLMMNGVYVEFGANFGSGQSEAMRRLKERTDSDHQEMLAQQEAAKRQSIIQEKYDRVLNKYFAIESGTAASPQATDAAEGHTNDWVNGGTLSEVTIKGKGFFGSLWDGVKGFFNSFEVEGSIVYSVGVQAGVGFKTPIGGIGVEANVFSVDIASVKELINGKDDGEVDYISKGHWMTLRQGAGIDFILGGASIEREMKSPTGGGGFFDKKVTEEVKILGANRKKEYYQNGLQTQPLPTEATISRSLKFGFNVQFLLGAKVYFEIRRRK